MTHVVPTVYITSGLPQVTWRLKEGLWPPQSVSVVAWSLRVLLTV